MQLTLCQIRFTLLLQQLVQLLQGEALVQGEYDYAVPSAANVKAARSGDPEHRQRFLVCKGEPKGKLQKLIARGLACAVENLIPIDRVQSRPVNHLRP